MGSMIELASKDGFKFSAWKSEPAGKPRGAVVVVQEIFGVNSHIKQVTDGYAADGYLAIAPAFFDRYQPGFDVGYTPAEIETARGLMGKVNWDWTMADLAAGIAAVKSAGKVGVVGYCWGGTVAWKAACENADVACAAPHYGGGIVGMMALQPKVPVMCHWGETDHAIPMEGVRKFEAAHPGVQSFVYAAGHGFNCDQRGSYDAASAKLARERTIEFLKKHVG